MVRRTYLIVCTLLVALVISSIEAQSSDPTPKPYPKVTDVEMKKKISTYGRDLIKTSYGINEDIVENRAIALLTYIHPKDGVSWGADGSLTYKEIKTQIEKKNGDFYCAFFKCPGNTSEPLSTILKTAKKSKLKLRLRPLPELSTVGFYLVEVIYEWPNRPKDDSFQNPYYYLGPDHKWYLQRPFIE